MAKAKKHDAKKIASELKSSDRWLVTVSKLNNETEKIETVTTSNNFLTNDLPLIRKHLSEQIYQLWAAKDAAEDGLTKEVNALEAKIQGKIQ